MCPESHILGLSVVCPGSHYLGLWYVQGHIIWDYNVSRVNVSGTLCNVSRASVFGIVMSLEFLYSGLSVMCPVSLFGLSVMCLEFLYLGLSVMCPEFLYSGLSVMCPVFLCLGLSVMCPEFLYLGL